MTRYIIFMLAIWLLVSAATSKSATHEVEITQAMKFVPATLVVNKGDKVIWTNKSSILHNVVSPPIKMRSKMLKKGEKFEFTFDHAGMVDYYCEPHRAHMKGKVEVKDK